MEPLFPSSAERPMRFGNVELLLNHLRFSQRPECWLFRNRQQLCLHVPACVPDPVLSGMTGCYSAACLQLIKHPLTRGQGCPHSPLCLKCRYPVYKTRLLEDGRVAQGFGQGTGKSGGFFLP